MLSSISMSTLAHKYAIRLHWTVLIFRECGRGALLLCEVPWLLAKPEVAKVQQVVDFVQSHNLC